MEDVRDGKVQLHYTSILNNGKVREVPVSIVVYYDGITRYMDIDGFRPDPSKIMKGDRKYKAKLYFDYELQTCDGYNSGIGILRHFILEDTGHKFANIR